MAGSIDPTPSDTPKGVPPPEAPRPSVPGRGRRKRVLGEGEGDYCIYEIVGVHQHIPRGSLLQIPGIPRFVNSKDAVDWVKTESGSTLHGKQVMVLKACEIMSITVEDRPTVIVRSKMKVTVEPGSKPEKSKAARNG